VNIVLIGYRCSGKTVVGKIIARNLSRDFYDTDTLIENNAGCSIEAIISRDGWEYFRETERQMVAAVAEKDDVVIATGGGVVMDEANMVNLRRKGLIVWLDAKMEVIEKRMAKDQQAGNTRPSLTGGDSLQEIKQVLDFRRPLYEKQATIAVDTSNLSTVEVASAIMESLSEELRG